MHLDKHKHIIYLLSIIAIFLFWTCSPKFNYEVKSFLFDGVPDPYEVEVTIIKDSLQTKDSTVVNDVLVSSAVRNDFNLHTPYGKKECKKCHDRDSMDKPVLPLPELCYQCHEDFNTTYQVVHGPVASGACTQCHSPHKSKLKNLLLHPGQELCLDCHSKSLVLEEKIHVDIDDADCTECHNPHGGTNRFTIQPEGCYECHDNFEKKFEFLHGPVASDDCSQCHGSHKSKKENLLVDSGENLCFSCHNSKETLEHKYHQNMEENNCTKCHDPHGGENEKLLFK
jgi:predicted CXXCH cytochrome family protein